MKRKNLLSIPEKLIAWCARKTRIVYLLKFVTACLFIMLQTQAAYSQIDTDFWFAAPEVSQSNALMLDRQIIMRVTTYGAPASITITQPATLTNLITPTTVLANTTQPFDLTSAIANIENTPANTVLNYGIKVSSTQPISVYYEVVSGNYGAANADNPEAFVLKGKNALGTSFVIPSQNTYNNSTLYTPAPRSSFDIVATQPGTVVTINPSNNIVGHAAGSIFAIMLNAGQTYSATASSNLAGLHLGGSIVTSNNPIAITVKDDLLQNGGCADLTGDQIIPVTALGTEYIAIRGQLASGDMLYITATQPGTNVYINGSASPVTTINTGQTYSTSVSGASRYIQTSAPAYVWQLSGSGCELGGAILPPINCTGSDAVSYTRSSNNGLFINLLVPTGSQGNFLISGNLGSFLTPTPILAGLFSAVPGTGGAWMAASIPYTLGDIPQGTVVRVTNTSAKFHMSTIDINAGSGGGTSYGYFSDYGSLSATITVNPSNPCVGDAVQFSTGSIPGASYYWTGPNGFVSTLQNPFIPSIGLPNSGIYTVTVYKGGCMTTAIYKLIVKTCPPDCLENIEYCVSLNNPYIVNFTATGIPSGGTYSWQFGDGTTASTPAGSISHTYPGTGSYLVTVKYTKGEINCERTFRICLADNPRHPQSKATDVNVIGENGENMIGELYPNPTNTEINIPIQFETDGMHEVEVSVLSVDGRKLSSQKSTIGDMGTIKLKTSELHAGTYLCEISCNGSKYLRKFVKI